MGVIYREILTRSVCFDFPFFIHLFNQMHRRGIIERRMSKREDKNPPGLIVSQRVEKRLDIGYIEERHIAQRGIEYAFTQGKQSRFVRSRPVHGKKLWRTQLHGHAPA